MRALFGEAEQAEDGLVIGRLDQGDGGNLDALVGAVQALVADTEACCRRDTKLGEVPTFITIMESRGL